MVLGWEGVRVEKAQGCEQGSRGRRDGDLRDCVCVTLEAYLFVMAQTVQAIALCNNSSWGSIYSGEEECSSR